MGREGGVQLYPRVSRLVGQDGAEGGVWEAAQHQDGRHRPSLPEVDLSNINVRGIEGLGLELGATSGRMADTRRMRIRIRSGSRHVGYVLVGFLNLEQGLLPSPYKRPIGVGCDRSKRRSTANTRQGRVVRADSIHTVRARRFFPCAHAQLNCAPPGTYRPVAFS